MREGTQFTPAVAIAVAALFLGVNVASLVGLWMWVDRRPAPVEIRRSSGAEVALRWRDWTAGRIFPEGLRYGVEGQTEMATRVGIGTGTDCASAVDPGLRPALAAGRCRALLRATYLDQMQGIAVTLGVAAFPDERAAYRARQAIPGGPPWLRALPLAGTPAADFDDSVRQTGTADRAGPYVVLATAGQADGRPAGAAPDNRPGLFDSVPQLAQTLAAALADPATPPCDARTRQC
jgi:hypothetical protein